MVAFGTRRLTIPAAKFLKLKPNMKTRTIALLLTGLCLAALPLAAQSTRPAIFPDEDPLSPENLRLVWPATPGLRYEVRQSTNLQSWSTAPGYPATANGPAQQMPFQTTGNARFFQVRELDEQPPAIASQHPPDGGFAVPRFANITLQLTDATGINPDSIRLTVGTLGTFTLTNPPPSATNAYLTFTNGLLTFLNGGSLPLGAWGSNIQATLVVADTLGYTATNAWRFDLEVQAQVVTNLFVFGSPQAQRTGQQIGNIPTAALARRFGPIPMGAGEPWTLELVASNRLELSYTNTAPGFATNLYVCNLTPVGPEDIFNRRITGTSDDQANKRLTLFTVEVPLTDLATNGSASVSAESVILEAGTNGAFVKAFYVGGTITFPRMGYSLDGAEFTLKDSVGDFDLVKLTMEEQHWWLTPRLQVGLDLGWGGLKRFEAIASGNVDAASVWEADVLLAGAALETTLFALPENLKPQTWMYLGAIGPVPVFASLGLDVELKARAEAHATLNFRAGVRQTMDAAFGLTYNKPDVQWVHTFQFPPPEVIPFAANINAEGSFKVSLEPVVEFLVYGLAGVSAGVTPSGTIVFEAGTGQPLSGRLEADVSLDLGLAGPAFDLLNPKPESSLPLWHDEWHLFPNTTAIAFTTQPESQTRSLGASTYFSCAVSATGTPTYQWYANGVPMAGQTSRTLLIPSVNYGHAGSYYVRVTAGGQSSDSAPATLIVLAPSLQSGLVAYYPFDGNANDASGNARNGIIEGAVPAPDRFSTPNTAYSFSGTNSIRLPVNINSDVLPELTISVWVNPGQQGPTHSDRHMVWSHDNGLYDRSLQIEAGNWSIYTGGSSYWPTGVKAEPNAWQHVVVVYSTTDVTLFKNNARYSFGSAPIPDNGESFISIGKYPSGIYDESFWGAVDDVRIYNRALSESEIQQLYNLGLPPAPAGMALIPAGSFQMGDSFDGYTEAQPVHTVYVSAFTMDKHDVTKALWDDVYNWAITHGYSFEYGAHGKAANHPAHSMTWYDAVKWCNARSEKEGRTPAYYTNAGLTNRYRTGQWDPYVNWSSGYRLPTEAEWEKAARGGASGQRFPWGNTISWSQANYYTYSPGYYSYDVNSTSGYHPVFNDGYPYTSPVDYFAPNSYGLYAMTGNVWQCCWDWYGSYSSASHTDPRGPNSGSNRVVRGGSWGNDAFYCQAAFRSSYNPSSWSHGLGFRSVLPPGQ